MAEVAEHLPSKQEALSSNLLPPKESRETEREEPSSSDAEILKERNKASSWKAKTARRILFCGGRESNQGPCTY
jgi:hypothetical protein